MVTWKEEKYVVFSLKKFELFLTEYIHFRSKTNRFWGSWHYQKIKIYLFSQQIEYIFVMESGQFPAKFCDLTSDSTWLSPVNKVSNDSKHYGQLLCHYFRRRLSNRSKIAFFRWNVDCKCGNYQRRRVNSVRAFFIVAAQWVGVHVIKLHHDSKHNLMSTGTTLLPNLRPTWYWDQMIVTILDTEKSRKNLSLFLYSFLYYITFLSKWDWF